MLFRQTVDEGGFADAGRTEKGSGDARLQIPKKGIPGFRGLLCGNHGLNTDGDGGNFIKDRRGIFAKIPFCQHHHRRRAAVPSDGQITVPGGGYYNRRTVRIQRKTMSILAATTWLWRFARRRRGRTGFSAAKPCGSPRARLWFPTGLRGQNRQQRDIARLPHGMPQFPGDFA